MDTNTHKNERPSKLKTIETTIFRFPFKRPCPLLPHTFVALESGRAGIRVSRVRR